MSLATGSLQIQGNEKPKPSGVRAGDLRALTRQIKEQANDNTTMREDIFRAAALMDSWDANGLRYDLFAVPRDAIDEGSDEPDAHLLIGRDQGNVRRVDVLMDAAYGRTIEGIEDVEAAMESVEGDILEILRSYTQVPEAKRPFGLAAGDEADQPTNL